MDSPVSQKSSVKNFIEKFEKYGQQDTVYSNSSNESVNEIKVAPIKEKFENNGMDVVKEAEKRKGVGLKETKTDLKEQTKDDRKGKKDNDQDTKELEQTAESDEQETNDQAKNIEETEQIEKDSVHSSDDDDGLNVNTSQPESTLLKSINSDELINSTIDLMFPETKSADLHVPESQYLSHRDLSSLLSARSRIIYEQLVCLPIQETPPILWSNSYMRALLYNILNIKDHGEIHQQKLITSSSKTSTTDTSTTVHSTLFNQITELMNKRLQHHTPQAEFEDPAVKFNVTEVKPQILQEIKKISNNEEILDLSAKLIDMKLKHMDLLKDKQTYEQVINNLVGHTQRLRRSEIAKYNKKHHRQSKRNSLWPL
ncbi:hypothetical protein ACO0QE_004663 [Hanseniaspora vineae]